MRTQIREEMIHYHEIPKAVLLMDLEKFEEGKKTPYTEEYLRLNHKDTHILYNIHLGLFSDRINIKGYLAEKKELEQEVKIGYIKPISMDSSDVVEIIENVLVDIGFLFKDGLGKTWALRDSTGEININLETGERKYQYDCFDDGTYYITHDNIKVK